MADVYQVLAVFQQYTLLDEQGAANALPLCSLALGELTARLRPGANPQDPRLIHAAAALAVYKWKLREQAGEGETTYLKAGDMVVRRQGDALQHIRQLKDEAMLCVQPLLEDEQFLFRCVEV